MAGGYCFESGHSFRVAGVKGELEKAEGMLADAEAELRRISALSDERKQEIYTATAELQAAAADGDMDRVMVLQSRLTVLDRTIIELSESQAQCAKRVESVGQYLSALRQRLDTLQQEAATLEQVGDQSRLARVRVQIEAITGGKGR